MSGSGDETIRLWDVEKQAPLGEPLLGHTAQVMSVAFSPDGHYLASGGWNDRTVFLWDITQQPPQRNLLGYIEPVTSVAFSPDGRYLASSSENCVRLWEVPSGRCLSVFHWQYDVTTVALIRSPVSASGSMEAKSSSNEPKESAGEENWLAIGDDAGMISFWAVSSKDASLQFVGMPPHPSMPLYPRGAKLQGCQMDKMGQRLLAQYGADVSGVVVEDEKKPAAELESSASAQKAPGSVSGKDKSSYREKKQEPSVSLLLSVGLLSSSAAAAAPASPAASASASAPQSPKSPIPALSAKQQVEVKKTQRKLKHVKELLEEVYPADNDNPEHAAKRKNYSDQLHSYQAKSETLTPADHAALVKLETALEQEQALLSESMGM